MPWWLAGISFYMASFSTMLFVIYSEIAYTFGIVAMMVCWLGPPAFLLGSIFTAHRWRRARVMTPLGFIERRFNRKVHYLFVWTGFPLRLFDNALRLYSTAIVMAVAFRGLGWSVGAVLVLTGIVMVLYSFMGGQLGHRHRFYPGGDPCHRRARPIFPDAGPSRPSSAIPPLAPARVPQPGRTTTAGPTLSLPSSFLASLV